MESTDELNESVRELAETLRSFTGSLQNTANAADGATKNMTALEAAEKSAKDKMQQSANNFKSAVDNAGTAMSSFAKAALSAEEGFKKYGNALNSAGDAAFDIGKNFGILGIAIGGLLKGIGLFAGEALRMHDTMIQMNRDATKFAGVLPGTVRNVADLAAQAGYAGEKMLKLIKITEGVGNNLVALGGTAGSGVIKFERLANVGNRVYEQFSKLGVSQESLTKMQADYIRLQGMSGQSYALQNKTMGQLQKESLGYAENLIKMSAITGEQADDLQKQREAVKAEMEERIKARQDELAAQKAEREGNTQEAKRIRSEAAARDAILNKMTDTYGSEVASMVGRVLRTGAFDQFSSGLAAMGLNASDLQGQMQAMAKGIAGVTDQTTRQRMLNDGALKVADQYNNGLDNFVTNLGDAAQFAKGLPAAFGVTGDALAKSNLAIGKTASEREEQAAKEFAAKKNQADADAALRAQQESAERELQKAYQTQMLNLATMIIPAVNNALGFFQTVMNAATEAVNFVIDGYNALAPILQGAMDILNAITDIVLYPILEVGGAIANNWDTIVTVSKDVLDLFLWPFLQIGTKITDVMDNYILPVMTWFGEKFKALGDAIGGLIDKVGGWLGIDTGGESSGPLDWIADKAGKAIDAIHATADTARKDNKEAISQIARSRVAKETTDAVVGTVRGTGDFIERRSQLRAGQIGDRVGMSGETVREIGRIAVGAVAGGTGAGRLAGSAARILKMDRMASAAMVGKSAAVGGTIGGMMTSGGEMSPIDAVAPGNLAMDPIEANKIAEKQVETVKAHTDTTKTQISVNKEHLEQDKKIAKEHKEISVENSKLFKVFSEAIKAATTSLTPFKQSIDDIVTQIGTSILVLQQMSPAGPGGTSQILATIKQRESGGNYKAQAKGSSASGAYQFTDSTWQSLTKKYKIGEIFRSAKDAPPEIQDAVAGKYVEEILQEAGGDVSKVPLKWYTGNIQGNISAAALAANKGLTPQMYQQKWMVDYNRMGAMMGNSMGAGDIASIGRSLQSQGFNVSENPLFGGVTPGVHKGAGHAEGRAIDVNVVAGDDSKDPVAAAKLDALAQQLGTNSNLTVLWRKPGHFDHMHIETKKISAARGGVFSGSTGGYPATLHGTEMVAPLKADSILMKLAKTPAGATDSDIALNNIIQSKSSMDVEKLVAVQSKMIEILGNKLDNVIYALESGNNTQTKILRHSLA